MKKTIVASIVLVLLLAAASSASAKNNVISLYGSYGPTYMGVEYERRLGDFGVGLDFGFLPANSSFQMYRISALGRYYFDVDFPVKPYLSLYPGVVLFVFGGSPPTGAPAAMPYETEAGFSLYATAGAEYKISMFRTALEIGGGFLTYPAVTAGPPVNHFLLVKGSVGVVF